MTLKEKLLSIGGNGILGDQLEYDPDAESIKNRGKLFPVGKLFVEMQTNGCHWNVSKLFEDGDIDHIVIGYALSKEGAWFQHTWGLKDGEVTETSRINSSHIEVYFGTVLDDPNSFVRLCKTYPKGMGKVRRVDTTTVEN